MKYSNRTQRRRRLLRMVAEQGGNCFYCGHSLDTAVGPHTGPFPPLMATIDHLIPNSRGGAHGYINTVVSCHACNHSRGAEQNEKTLAEIERRGGEAALMRQPTIPLTHGTTTHTQMPNPQTATVAALANLLKKDE